MIPAFVELLEKMKTIHEKKNRDYAAPENPFENFERSAELATWFDDDVNKAFIILIGTKLARLATLLNSKAAPNNESIGDSFLDLTTYCALWSAYYSSRAQPKTNHGLQTTMCNTALHGFYQWHDFKNGLCVRCNRQEIIVD